MTRRLPKSKREIITASFWLFSLCLLLTIWGTAPLHAQTSGRDTLQSLPDTLLGARRQGADSLSDTLAKAVDTADKAAQLKALGIRISPDALPATVKAAATDSAVLDLTTNNFFLYGNAQVDYEDLTLTAGKVIYDQGKSTITAQPFVDSSAFDPGAPPAAIDSATKGRPTFTQGAEKFTYDELRYNFGTKKALVRNARTQYGEGFIYSEQVKRAPDQSIYGAGSVYTTCNLDTPHFGVHARRIKVIPGRVAVAGPANLEIEGVPTPLFLPFALFPISEQQRSGFRIPSYTIEQQRGLGLTNGGYYVYFSDKADLLLTGNVYSKGSFNVSAVSAYANRYHYSGGVNLAYGFEKTGESFEPSSIIRKTFAIAWTHRSDAKARPGLTFEANVNIQKGNYYQRNSYNPSLVLNNQFNSSLTLSRTFTTRPMSITAGANLNQTQIGQATNNVLTLPSFNFYYSQITPFKRKVQLGAPKWYEKITASYTFNLQNQLSFYDTAFAIDRLGFTDFRNGIVQRIPISASYTALRFINISFGANYNEYWLARKDVINYNSSTEQIDTLTSTGFFTTRDANASVNASTRIYGMKLFKTGKIAGIRHVLTPNVGFSYTPDFAKNPFRGAYLQQLSAGGAINYQSPYQFNAIVPGGPFGSFSSSLNYGLNNNLQMKVRTKSDSAGGTKNVTLIDGLALTGSYNLAADSFQWSDVGLSFRTNILDKINISANALFDPYGVQNATGNRRRETLLSSGAGLARLRNASISASASFRSGGKTPELIPAGESPADRYLRNRAVDYVDFNIPWNANIGYSLTASNVYNTRQRADTLIVNQGVTLSGDFNLTPRWKIAVTTSYNATTTQLGFTSLDIYRDLHCFEMRLNTIPFGPLKSYTFTLNVKAQVLQDLRLLRRRDFRDTVY
jgi:lipopolysaccharide assembly outer membrane protein LptD (OstA)